MHEERELGTLKDVPFLSEICEPKRTLSAKIKPFLPLVRWERAVFCHSLEARDQQLSMIRYIYLSNLDILGIRKRWYIISRKNLGPRNGRGIDTLDVSVGVKEILTRLNLITWLFEYLTKFSDWGTPIPPTQWNTPISSSLSSPTSGSVGYYIHRCSLISMSPSYVDGCHGDGEAKLIVRVTMGEFWTTSSVQVSFQHMKLMSKAWGRREEIEVMELGRRGFYMYILQIKATVFSFCEKRLPFVPGLHPTNTFFLFSSFLFYMAPNLLPEGKQKRGGGWKRGPGGAT